MLSTIEILRLARDWFPAHETARTMTQIILAESGGDERAQGDNVLLFDGRYDRFQCNNFLSFGLGQVFLGVHTPMIQTMSGLVNSCDLAEWLFDPNNNLRALAAIYANQGFNAWSVYKNGAYRLHLEAVEEAERQLDAEVPPEPVEPPAPGRRTLELPIDFRAMTADGQFFIIRLE